MSDYEEELLEDDAGAAAPPADLREDALALVRAVDPEWSESERLELGTIAWKPDAVKDDGAAILHIHVADRLRPYVVDRMRAALDAGRSVHVALPLAALFDEVTLQALSEVDASVYVLREGGPSLTSEHLLAALADEGVAVTTETRRLLARAAWSRRREGNTYQRGRRFEAFLAFLLAQISDFRVRERNLRGATDELDIVVQIDRITTRCWYESGVPFILVEAKNWVDPVDQKEVSAFMTKIGTKRGRAKIGVMIGAGGFTSSAELQELKHATQDIVVVFVGPVEIEAWIEDDDPDEYFEERVRSAMLR